MAMLMTSDFQEWKIYSEEFCFNWSDKGKKDTAWMKEKSLSYWAFCYRIFISRYIYGLQSIFHQRLGL